MRVRIFIILAILAAAELATLIDNFTAPKIETARPAPVFMFETLDGKQRSIADFKGKTVLLNFWASWCIPCRAELPELIQLAKDNPTRLELILMSEDSAPQKAAEFIKVFSAAHQLQVDLPNVMLAWDGDQKIAAQFQTAAYPETAVIGPDQTLQYKIIGALTADDIKALKNNN
jgi:thiol-disulfide isomerase/thioredoxin